ncbi:MAG: ATP-binding protein [Oscillochloridaceae bacterium umkhey_bin13]
MLTIQLFGQPSIYRDAQPIPLPRRRARALVFYLAAQQAPVRREQLLNLLWPDHERSTAQQILRTTLHAVRRVLDTALQGDDPLTITPTTYVDYRHLAHLVAQPTLDEATLAQALLPAKDELLADFSLPDAEPFEQWLAAERERARLLAIRGYTRLARMQAARHAYPAALTALGQALAFDPLQEDLQRDAIRLHYLAGDRVGAIRRYEQLRDLLDEQLGVPPMRETLALYDAIITDQLVADSAPPEPERPVPAPLIPSLAPEPPPLSLPFVGRDAELARVATIVSQGRLALIEGEPGIGKTRLAAVYLEQTRRSGGLALSGSARELEQGLPYQPMITMLRTLADQPVWPMLRDSLALDALWLHEAARLAPELLGDTTSQGTPGRAEEARLWEGVARLILALARRSPVAVLLDDAHWADASSLGLFGYLLRRSEGHPLRLIATARPTTMREPLGQLITALTREGRIERLALPRLDRAATTVLAQTVTPANAGQVVNWLEQQAEGNPYMIVELLSHARETGLLTNDGRLQVNSPALPLPQTIYSLIESRLARLSEGARRVLDAAVAAGREFAFEVVTRAAALSESAALDALDELRTARLIEPLPDGRFRFDHSLTMEVAYREVGELRHRVLHRRVAEALEALHRDHLDLVAGLIASHYAEGGDAERAAAFALRAGRQAARVAAWAEAIGFYEQALAATPPAQRFATLIALGEALYLHGEAARATERMREALTLARDPAQQRQARLSLAGALVVQARYSEVIALMQPISVAGPPAERAKALFRWGTALSLEGADLAGAAARLGEAATLLADEATPDPVSLAQIRFELGGVAAQQGDLDLALSHYRVALAIAEAATDDPAIFDGAVTWRILAHNNLAYHLHVQGQLEAAAQHCAAGLVLAEARGTPGLLPYLRSTEGEIALARGDLEAAEAAFSTGLALAERLSVPERVAGLTANLGLVAQRRGQEALAVHRLSAALAQADALGTRHLATQIRIWLAPLLPPEAARILLAEARASAEAGGRQHLLAAIDTVKIL